MNIKRTKYNKNYLNPSHEFQNSIELCWAGASSSCQEGRSILQRTTNKQDYNNWNQLLFWKQKRTLQIKTNY